MRWEKVSGLMSSDVFAAAVGGGDVPGSDSPQCRLHQFLPSVRHGSACLQAVQTGWWVPLTSTHRHITTLFIYCFFYIFIDIYNTMLTMIS